MRLHYTEFMNPTHSEFQLGRSQVVPPFLSYSVTYLRIHTWVVQPHRCEFAEQDTTEASTTQTSIHFKGIYFGLALACPMDALPIIR